MRCNVFAVVCSLLILALLLIAAPNVRAASENGFKGVPNFGKVTDTLFRGAQPSPAGFGALKTMGVGIVVNFRDEIDEITTEQHNVESLGMKYIGIPWNGGDDPSSTKILQFLDLVRSNPQTKIFVHCKAGADRTGTMIAAYRIADEHKSAADALKEMYQYHYHHFFLPQLERWVAAFPSLLTSNSQFSAYSPAVELSPLAKAVAETAIVPAMPSSQAVVAAMAP